MHFQKLKLPLKLSSYFIQISYHIPGYDDLLELLVMNKANLNARTRHGVSILMRACDRGHRCTVELLLAMGAQINVTTYNGETALIKVMFGFVWLMNYIFLGADVFLRFSQYNFTLIYMYIHNVEYDYLYLK